MYYTWLDERQYLVVELFNVEFFSHRVFHTKQMRNISKTFASVQIRLKIITRFSYYRRLTKL